MKLAGKHAEKMGYTKYVGEEVKVTGKNYDDGEGVIVEVTMDIKELPFPVSLAVHKEDVTYG